MLTTTFISSIDRGGEEGGGRTPGGETGADDELQQHRQTQAGAAHRGDRADPSSL